MSAYLSAFRGRLERNDIPGLLWAVEPGTPARAASDHLRIENPWIAPRVLGREVFTLLAPDDPAGSHLGELHEGAHPLDLRQSGSRGLLLTLLLSRLRDKKILVDQRTGFVTLSTEDLPDGRMAVEGIELRLEALDESTTTVWCHPIRRVLDGRPVGLEEATRRACDLWFPIEGISIPHAATRKVEGGLSVQIGRRSRLVRLNDAVAVVLSEGPGHMPARQLVSTLRGWTAHWKGLLELEKDPLPAQDLGFALKTTPPEPGCGLDWKGQKVDLDDLFRSALGGHTSLRVPRLPPATFHLSGLRSREDAEETAAWLNQKAADWSGVALQFASEPVANSLELKLEARSPLVTAPGSPRAIGHAAGLFLECVRRAGGEPWRLSWETSSWSLGITQSLLFGRMHHIAVALIDPAGTARAGLVVPFRHSDLGDKDFGRNLARKLGQSIPEGTVVHLDETLDGSFAFLEGLVSNGDAWKLRRRSVPRGILSSTFAWLDEGSCLVSPDAILSSLPGPEGRSRHLSMERVQGVGDPLQALAQCLFLEFAWSPGRAERRILPATLEWARGLLFQRDRYAPLLTPSPSSEISR